MSGDTERGLVRDQFLAKLQRKKRHLSKSSSRDFETVAGMPPDAFIQHLKEMSLDAVAAWFIQHPGPGEILDRKGDGAVEPIVISEHADRLRSVEHGYGQGTRPEDYLEEFSAFLRKQGNAIPALVTVLTRPRDLTRKQLPELALEQKVLLADYLPYSETVKIPAGKPKVPTCRDPFDVPFLLLAVAGKADFLVTGDQDLLSLDGQASCPIVTTDAFLQTLSSSAKGEPT